MKIKRTFITVLIHLLMIIVTIFCIYPLFVMISGSLKTPSELAQNPGGIPRNPTLANYTKLFTYNSGLILRTYVNAIFISSAHVLLTLYVSALAAFAFSKYRFYGQRVLFSLLLATIMVPRELGIPPLYIFFSRIRWLDSYQVQIIPFVANVFAMFMLHQYMLSIPNDLIDAAKIDGARTMKIFHNILVPTAMPALGALTILVFLHKWNDYLWPLIMVSKQEILPILVILPRLSVDGDIWIIPWEIVLAGCVLSTLPILICFFVFQEKFMSSVTIGAIKE